MPARDDLVTLIGTVPVLLPGTGSTPPILPKAVSTVALLVATPPAGQVSKWAGMVMVTVPVLLSRPSAQLTVLTAKVQVPVAAGEVLAQLIGPVMDTPAGRVSVRSVCSELPGPLLLTVTDQLNGCLIVTAGWLTVLTTARSMRWRTVVASEMALLPTLLSGSLADTDTVLLNTSPLADGVSSASKRRKMSLL